MRTSPCSYLPWQRLLVCVAVLVSLASSQAAEPSNPVASESSGISFELDVMPVLTRYGCNTGACHGKQRGQNGFQLSLLGFDSDFDYFSITQQARGRRVFPADPDDSLLLQKATALLPHGGGRKIEVDSEPYVVLRKWIEEGAIRARHNEPTLSGIELASNEFRLEPKEAKALSVQAVFSDGSRRDVTPLATYLSNDAAIAEATDSGEIVAGELPGETAVMIRYMNHIKVANVIIPFGESVPAEYYSELPKNNFIDELMTRKLAQAGSKYSAPANDATFLRRVYVDLVGRFPTVAEAHQFLDSDVPHKRELLVDRLLDSSEYADHWANQWADLLRPNPYRVGIKAVLNYDNWIRDQFRRNVPYDEMVRSLVTAQGSTWRNGAVTLFRDRRSPDEAATLISQLFLGIRLDCAKCHHHPFENWSQEDFYRFSAYFAQIGFKGTGLSPPISGGEEIVFDQLKGEVKHPVTGETLEPRYLFQLTEAEGSEASDPHDSVDPNRRQSLANWLTSEANPYFAQVQVNRIWAVLMGRGLVEPVDDLRSTNPPTNPALLEALGSNFQEHGFDLKWIIKTIVLSRAYSVSSEPNETNAADRLNYSRHYRHRLRAEVLMDSIAGITETPHGIRGMPSDASANQVWTHRVNSMFLDTFGRPDANQDPPCERTSDSTVTQSLHLMNSVELDRRIRSDSGRAARLAASDATDEEIVVELYLAVFSRYPSDQEKEFAVGVLRNADERRGAIEDLMWAMINSPECVIQN